MAVSIFFGILQSLNGYRTSYCRGRGGSMHIADQDNGNLGADAIVGRLQVRIENADKVEIRMLGDLGSVNMRHAPGSVGQPPGP